MTTATQKKITIATVKAFIRKNREKLLIKVTSRFDSMVDGVRSTDKEQFTPALDAEYYDRETGEMVKVPSEDRSTAGIHGVWFVCGGGDWCQAFETETHIGYEVSNCCGSWSVAVAK